MVNKVKLSLYLIKWAPPHEDLWMRRYSSTSLDLYTRWLWVVRITLWPLYPWGKIFWYPLGRRLDGLQSQSVHCGEENNLFPSCRESNFSCVAHSPSLWRVNRQIFKSYLWIPLRKNIIKFTVRKLCMNNGFLYLGFRVLPPPSPFCCLFCSSILSIWPRGIMNDYVAESWHFCCSSILADLNCDPLRHDVNVSCVQVLL